MHNYGAVRAVTSALAVLLLLAGCSSDSEPREEADATTTTAAEVTTTVVPSPTIDWDDIGVVDLGDGYTLRDEEGDAPIVAIYRGTEHVGIVEVNRFPKSSPTLEAHVEQFHSSLEADRRKGCGADYEYEQIGPEFEDGPDGRFAHYGFTGSRPGEPVTEKTLQWATFQEDELVIINVAAYDEDGCVGTEGAELTTAELERVESLLRSAVEASPFPR